MTLLTTSTWTSTIQSAILSSSLFTVTPVLTLTSTISNFDTVLTTQTLVPQVSKTMITVPITSLQVHESVVTSMLPAPSVSSVTAPPYTVTSITSSLVTTTILQPGQTVTYYPTAPTLSTSAEISATTTTPFDTAVATKTLTEVAFVLENTLGIVLSVLTTTLPRQAWITGPIIFVPMQRHNSWSTWSDAQKAGLIAGVTLIGIAVVAALILYIVQRRRKWYWVTNPWGRPGGAQPSMAYTGHAVVPAGYWGPGSHGWGLHN